MDEFLRWFATSPIASFLRVLLSTVITLAVADFVKLGAFDLSNWEAWLIAALAAAIPPLLRWLNPADTAYGIGKLAKKK
jgi:hypothetical protein